MGIPRIFMRPFFPRTTLGFSRVAQIIRRSSGIVRPVKNCLPSEDIKVGYFPQPSPPMDNGSSPAAVMAPSKSGKPLPGTRLQNGKRGNERPLPWSQRQAIRAESSFPTLPQFISESPYFPLKKRPVSNDRIVRGLGKASSDLETNEQNTRDPTIMKTNYLSAPVTDLDPSLVTIAAWDSRSPAISQKETKRTKVRGVGFAFLLALWGFPTP